MVMSLSYDYKNLLISYMGKCTLLKVSNTAAFLSSAKFWKKITLQLSEKRGCLANCTEKIR